MNRQSLCADDLEIIEKYSDTVYHMPILVMQTDIWDFYITDGSVAGDWKVTCAVR